MKFAYVWQEHLVVTLRQFPKNYIPYKSIYTTTDMVKQRDLCLVESWTLSSEWIACEQTIHSQNTIVSTELIDLQVPDNWRWSENCLGTEGGYSQKDYFQWMRIINETGFQSMSKSPFINVDI